MQYRVSAAAREIGVSAQTLRDWHRDGLLMPDIADAGTRLYDDADIEEGRRIKRMRAARGLKLGPKKQPL